MAYFIRQGNKFRSTPNSSLDIKDTLPVGTYALKVDDHGFYFEVIDDFSLPPKLYGNCNKFTDRIINTFHSREHATGVFLEGDKGSGKTLLAKNLSVRLREEGAPTVVVNQSLYGEEFNNFVQQLNQEALIIFDEFEKIYDEEQQDKLLTLFDGVYPTKKLFVITANESWRVNKHLVNRPGRMFYMLSFKGLDIDFVREYVAENLDNKENINGVYNVFNMFTSFSFDMLKALVEEMNRYNETATEAVTMLNAKPDANRATYNLKVVLPNGTKLDTTKYEPDIWFGNPLNANISLSLFCDDNGNKFPDEHDGETYVQLEANDITSFDGATGNVKYDKDNYRITLEKVKEKEFDWKELL